MLSPWDTPAYRALVGAKVKLLFDRHDEGMILAYLRFVEVPESGTITPYFGEEVFELRYDPQSVMAMTSTDMVARMIEVADECRRSAKFTPDWRAARIAVTHGDPEREIKLDRMTATAKA
jgi:hypothetical protein